MSLEFLMLNKLLLKAKTDTLNDQIFSKSKELLIDTKVYNI